MSKANPKQDTATQGEAPRGRRGRPTLYDPDKHVPLGRKLAEMGLRDDEIACAFDVTPQTFYNWKNKHPEFFEAVSVDAKAAFDQRVERSLAMQALGYEIEEDKIFFPSGAKDPVRVTVRKHVQGNPTAAIFWLKNRRPDIWRDRQDLNLQLSDGVSAVATEELERRFLEGLKDVTPQGVTQSGE